MTVVQRPPGARSIVREACLCGVDVIASGRSDQEVLEAIQRHQIEPVHERWAALQGYRGPLAEQVALMQLADELAATEGRRAIDGLLRTRRMTGRA
jgi:phosphopantetheine adenylyltransferase